MLCYAIFSIRFGNSRFSYKTIGLRSAAEVESSRTHLKFLALASKVKSLAVADLENFGGGDFKHKTSKIRMSSPKLRVIFRPKSEIQAFFSPKIRWSPKKKKKKKKKKVFTKIESDFSAGFVRFRLVGGDASLTGVELFQIEADFSAKIVTLHPPP